MYGYKAVLEDTRRGGTYIKGLYLRPLEYSAVKELVPEIDWPYPTRWGRTLLHAKRSHKSVMGHYSVWSVTLMTMKTGN